MSMNLFLLWFSLAMPRGKLPPQQAPSSIFDFYHFKKSGYMLVPSQNFLYVAMSLSSDLILNHPQQVSPSRGFSFVDRNTAYVFPILRITSECTTRFWVVCQNMNR